MRPANDTPARPWSVYVLIAVGLAGLIVGTLLSPSRSGWTIVSLGLAAIVCWGMWTAKPWAFSLSFMLASLCVGLVVLATFVQFFLFEQGVSAALLWTMVPAVIWIALLMHPATKRYAALA